MLELSNRLHESSSPYLTQHKDDPVHWQLWDEKALNYAKSHNKPILLSIGYAACHWCHVMAHESFADAKTAELMNHHFVNIKLDREERPDLDKIYQLAHQLLLQRPGGWPLTVFLTPDKHIPFFVGTYFPPEPRHGLPGFAQIIERVATYYHQEGETIAAQGEQIQNFFKTIDQREITQSITEVPIKQAVETLKAQYDNQFGGFGGAPKFPFPSSLDFLIKEWHKTAYSDEPDRDLLFMVSHTLQQMSHGGIYDQVGGGFYRYSVDQAWMIPHFEKMLYDNSQLLPLYAQLAQITGDQHYEKIALETAHWLQKDLLDQTDHLFFSTLDADSDNADGHSEEGEYYVWTRNELEDNLELEELYLLEQAFNLENPPNFEGRYHLYQTKNISELAESLQQAQQQLIQQLNQIKLKLLAIRDKRARPFRDEKKLSAWNALTIQGFAQAGKSLGNADLSTLSYEVLLAMKAQYENSETTTTRLTTFGLKVQLSEHSHPIAAFLDDYAFLLNAILEVLQIRWSTELINWAKTLADELINNFANEAGGFYFVSQKEADALLYRPLTYSDDALPNGNAQATLALLKIGYLLADTRYIDIAEKTIKHSFDEIAKSPQAHASMLLALDEYLNPSRYIILRGEKNEIEAWKNTLNKVYAPKIQIYAIANSETNLPASFNNKIIQEIPVAYICQGYQCYAPINDLEKLIEGIQ